MFKSHIVKLEQDVVARYESGMDESVDIEAKAVIYFSADFET